MNNLGIMHNYNTVHIKNEAIIILTELGSHDGIENSNCNDCKCTLVTHVTVRICTVEHEKSGVRYIVPRGTSALVIVLVASNLHFV